MTDAIFDESYEDQSSLSAPVEPTTPDDDVSEHAIDQRHQRRIQIMQALFAYGFTPEQSDISPALLDHVKAIIEESPGIDKELQTAAPERPLADINQIDLAILRLIMFESRHKKTPKKVLLNEAVELAKAYGSDSSPKFVNAVLGTLLLPATKEETKEE